MKKVLSTVLALSMLLVISGCTSNEKVSDTSDTTIIEPAVSDNENAKKPFIPDDAFYNGDEFRVLCIDGMYFGDDVEKMDLEKADVLEKAKYDRLQIVEENLGVDFKFSGVANNDVPTMIRGAVNAGSNDYEMTSGLAQHMASLVYEGLFVPVSELVYVDLEQPWWNKEYIESVSYDIYNPYILFGGINYNAIERTTCVFVNVPLLEDKAQISLSDLQKLVLEGKWTLDIMNEMISGIYSDTNGNTVKDMGDTFGFISSGSGSFNYMAFSSGLEFTSRDADGYPELALNNERTYDLVEKLLSLFINNEDTLNTLSYADNVNAFTNGYSLFMIQRFFVSSWGQMREMKQDYSILPIPKLDEDIDNYHSVVGELVQWHTVPITATDLDMISVVLEMLAYEGYERVVPAYYDTTLKLKYSRGDDLDTQSKILDIITDNARTDFFYINPTGSMQNIFKDIYWLGQNNFASLYAGYESSAEAAFESMREFVK